jgi:ABC-type Zn uptake system ZnuABC Zn-binding protein ZnuA
MDEITTVLAAGWRRSRLLVTLTGVSWAAIGTVACTPTAETEGDGRPQVVVTSTILTDLTATVGGDEIGGDGSARAGG